MKRILSVAIFGLLVFTSCGVRMTSVNIRISNNTAAASFAGNSNDALFPITGAGSTSAYQENEIMYAASAFIVHISEQVPTDPYTDTISVMFIPLHSYTIVINDSISGGYSLTYSDDGEI